MFERYPAESVRMLFLARAGAAAAGATAIEVEHLMTAAMTAREAPTSDGYPQLRGAQSEIPFSDPVKMILSHGAMTADALGHHRIRPEHILIALVDDASVSTAAAVRAAKLERPELVESAERQAAIDDSPLSYQARAVLKVRTENQ